MVVCAPPTDRAQWHRQRFSPNQRKRRQSGHHSFISFDENRLPMQTTQSDHKPLSQPSVLSYDVSTTNDPLTRHSNSERSTHRSLFKIYLTPSHATHKPTTSYCGGGSSPLSGRPLVTTGPGPITNHGSASAIVCSAFGFTAATDSCGTVTPSSA